MNRRRFVHGMAAGSAVVVATATSRAADGSPTVAAPGEQPPPPKPPLVSTPLVVQAPRTDGCEAVWGVSELCRGRIEWESASGERGMAAMEDFGFVPQGTRALRVRVRGFQPGVSYRLRSITTSVDGTRAVTSEWKAFRTLDSGAVRTRFVVWNDTHVNDETIRRLDDVTPAADFLLWNGDTCNDWYREEQLIPTLLHPGGRDITRGRPLLVVWGNHDVRGHWAFRMPDLIATPEGRPFCAFRSGPVAVVCLHTGEDKPDTHPSFGGRVAFDALRREQAGWLDTMLARDEMARAPYRVVFCHIPLRWTDESPQDYSHGGFDRHSGRSRAAWHDALVRWKAQVVISGHTHRPAWLPATEAIPYGQLIGGGPSPGAATWMEGEANSERLRLVVRKLDGSTAHEVTLNPVT